MKPLRGATFLPDTRTHTHAQVELAIRAIVGRILRKERTLESFLFWDKCEAEKFPKDSSCREPSAGDSFVYFLSTASSSSSNPQHVLTSPTSQPSVIATNPERSTRNPRVSGSHSRNQRKEEVSLNSLLS